MSGQQHAPAVLYPGERSGTHCTVSWVGPRAGLDGRNNSPYRDSIPGPSSPLSVAMPTELPCPHCLSLHFKNLKAEATFVRRKIHTCSENRGPRKKTVFITQPGRRKCTVSADLNHLLFIPLSIVKPNYPLLIIIVYISSNRDMIMNQ